MRRHAGLIPLSHDHQHALALCVLTERDLRSNPGTEAARRAAAKIVESFEGEILDHFQFEEEVLFPALENVTPLAEVVAELKTEHTRIRALVAELRARGEEATVLEFCALLRGHVQKEETILFERAQDLVPDEQLNAIGEKRGRRR